MTLELFFKIAFFTIFFSFAFVMTAYTKKAKTHEGNLTTRMRAHDEYEVPLLLKLRQLFGIPFYLGVLIWTFAPKYMEWSGLTLPVWLRWFGLALGVFAVFSMAGATRRSAGNSAGTLTHRCVYSRFLPW